MDKKEIRTLIRKLKGRLTDTDRLAKSERALRLVESIGQFESARNVLVYHSLPDELSTNSFIDRLAGTKNLFLPRVSGDTLEVLPYNPAGLQSGAFDIMEPVGNDVVDVDMMDAVIVPGVAFDRMGNRVGRGKGYYDRLLAGHPDLLLIGVGYDFQLIDSLEAEPHDIRMDYIVTDKEIINLTDNQSRRCR